MELTITYYENNEPVERETFTDFDVAVEFCEDHFNLRGGSWDYTQYTKDMYELFDYLQIEGVDVEIVEEESE